MAAGLFAQCLFAQGLQTKATKDDWEEINFEFNSAILSDGYPTLLRIAELLQQHRDYKIKVEGHTDYVGSAAYNERLALARANEVKAFLTKYGAGADQVSVSGQGKRNPEVPNTTKEGRFINRRVVLTVTDGSGNIIAAGTGPQVVNALDERLKKLEDCCNAILKKLDKLDDILAAIRDLKAENDRLKSDVAMLKNQKPPVIPPPPPPTPVSEIAKATADQMDARNKKFSLLGLNVGPTTYGGLTFTGSGRFFAPFKETHAVQAQGEYMYHGEGGGADKLQGRQEGQFDIGLVNRFENVQVGAFASLKYLNFAQFQSGGTLAQGAFTVDYIFKGGRVGIFGTKGIKNTADLNHSPLGPTSYIQTYAQIIDQIGGSALFGLWGDSYVEGNMGYLATHGALSAKPGGMIRLVQPVSRQVAVTMEAGLNETYVSSNNTGRVVFGLQFGNWMRPKEYRDLRSPVPVDVPRVRYQLLTRQVGHSAPVADAGPNQIVPPGTVTLNGSGSYSPDGDTLTYQWTQIAGPSVAISGANAAIATFQGAANQNYSFRLTVKSPFGLQSTATTSVRVTKTPGITIVEFTAAPDTITAGQSAQLIWNVKGATNISISPGIGTVTAQGQKTVSPTTTTTYTLTATADGVPTQTATATITIGAIVGNPQIIRFEATPTNIMSGESSTLSWTTQNAQTVTISGVPGNQPASGSVVVSPTQTTTYTLTASSNGVSVTAPVTVTVGNGQLSRIISFSASPASITSGGSSQLCWNVENATTVSINPGVGTVQASACTTVSPTSTTTYVLTARNGVGSVTASATVTVNAVKVLTFTSSPEFSTMAGSPVVLTWTTQGATSVNITGNITGPGIPATGLPANGSLTVNPNTNTDYTLTAYGDGGQAVSVTIHVFVR
jgi:hypothetical protein